MSSRRGSVKAKSKKATAKKAGKKKATKKSAGTAKKSAKKASKAKAVKSTKKAAAKKSKSTAPPVATKPPHTADQLRAIVSGYIAAYNARDVQSIIALYDPKATMADPIGLPPAVGHKAIAGLYQMGFDMNVSIAHDGAIRCAGSAVAFPLIASSPTSRLEVIDVFEFGRNGKIVQMRAYWGPDNLQGDLAVRQ